MKLRVHADSIRLRLNRRHVAEFAAGGKLTEITELGGGARLLYGLESSTDASVVGVRSGVLGSGDGTVEILIVLPSAVAEAWTGSEQVAIRADVGLDEGRVLGVLVEKEFRRMHGANKDPDLYPNPLERETLQQIPSAV